MSVATIYAPSTQPGNGIITAFQFAFKITAQSDLAVYKIDAAAITGPRLALNTDYSVTFDPVAENGTVTFAVAPVNGGFALIKRASDLTQGTVYPRDGSLPAKTTEGALDKLTMIVQEIEASGTTESPVELSGLYANRPTAPVIAVYYTSTDRGSYEKWVPALGRWILLG